MFGALIKNLTGGVIRSNSVVQMQKLKNEYYRKHLNFVASKMHSSYVHCVRMNNGYIADKQITTQQRFRHLRYVGRQMATFV